MTEREEAEAVAALDRMIAEVEEMRTRLRQVNERFGSGRPPRRPNLSLVAPPVDDQEGDESDA